MTEIYTVKDRWGYWWSSAASPEEGYLLHKPGEGAVTIKLRTLDHIIQNYGILDDGEAFDFDAWAEEALKRTVKPARAIPAEEFKRPERDEDPSVIDPEVSLEITLDLMNGERKRSEKLAHLRYFALRLWDAAEEATAEDMSKCCGCSGSDKELNPFKERRESDE